MTNHQGFSLTEVLVSLLLITSTSLALLRQQWQLSQILNQALMASRALVLLDNNSEKILARQPLREIEKPFQFSQSESNQSTLLQITWSSISLTNSACCSLQRQLVPIPLFRYIQR